MTSYLHSDKANLSSLREALRRELFQCLDNCGVGSKALVWDESLIGRFGLVVDQFKILQEHGVDKMFMMKDFAKDNKLRESCRSIKNIVFVVRPKLEIMELIDNVIKAEDGKGSEKEF